MGIDTTTFKRLGERASTYLGFALCLILLSHLSSSARAQSDVFDIDVLGSSVELGLGFHTTGAALTRTPLCIETDKDTVGTGDAGQGSVQVDLLNSLTDLRERLAAGASVSARFIGGSVSAKVKYIQQAKLEKNQTTIAVTAEWSNAPKSIIRAQLTQEAALLWAQDPQAFLLKCGDGFISDIYTGGKFVAILEVDSVDASKISNFTAKLSAKFMGTAVDVDAEDSKSFREMASKTRARIFLSGGTETFPSLDGLLEFALSFRKQVDPAINPDAKPTAFRFKVTKYEKLIRPSDSLKALFDGTSTQREFLEYVSRGIDELSTLESCFEAALCTPNNESIANGLRDIKALKDKYLEEGRKCYYGEQPSDSCKTKPERITYQCPVSTCPTDEDGDRVGDLDDKCPKVSGPAHFQGCPDTDQDGIPDHLDACPVERGTEGRDCATTCERVAARPGNVRVDVATMTTTAAVTANRRIPGTDDYVSIQLIGECGDSRSLELWKKKKDDHEPGFQGKYSFDIPNIGPLQKVVITVTHNEKTNPGKLDIDDWHYEFIKLRVGSECMGLSRGRVASNKNGGTYSTPQLALTPCAW